MIYNIIDTNNKKYKIININRKTSNKFLMNILIGLNIKNLENNKLNELVNELKIKLNKKISKGSNNKFNRFNKSHLNILEKILNINLIIYDNDFKKIYNGDNKSNNKVKSTNKVELIKKGNSYNLLIKNIRKNAKIIQKGGGKGEDFLNSQLNKSTLPNKIIDGYQNCGVYSVINKYIRNGIKQAGNDFEDILNDPDNQNEKEVIYINKLDNIINTTRGYNNYLYRGIPNSIIEEYKIKSRVKQEEKLNIINNAYTSSSTDIIKATDFSDVDGVIMIFKIPSGIKYHEMNNKGEGEILIQRGTKFTNINEININKIINNRSILETIEAKNLIFYEATLKKHEPQIVKETLIEAKKAFEEFKENEEEKISNIVEKIRANNIEMNRRSIKKFLKDNNYVIDDVEIEEILIELEIFCNSNSNSNSD